MARSLRFTSADLEVLPEDGRRYEIIDGELYVSKQPTWEHQLTCSNVVGAFLAWNRRTGLGLVAIAPGLIFAEDDDVAPDIVWVSKSRLAAILGEDHKLHAAPDLVVEVLSPGKANQQRDRDAKLRLYSRRGVREYWIVDWMARQIEVYRRVGTELELVVTLLGADLLESPMLPGFGLPLADVFADLPPVTTTELQA